MIVAPPVPKAGWRGAIIDRHDLGGERLFSVVTRRAFGQTSRRWFGDRQDALIFALDQADLNDLPLIDLTAAEEPEAG